MKIKILLCLSCIILYSFSSVAQEVITSAGTINLPTVQGGTKIVASGQSLVVTSNQSVILGPGFHAQAGSDVLIRIGTVNIYPVPPLVSNENLELNWVFSRSFNERGDTIGESKKYFDLSGKGLQSQVKSFTTRNVFASQSIYDQFGNAAIQTLAAPVNNSGFSYKSDFVQNSSGNRYNINNFDVAGKINSPDPVNSSQQGSLGWYYSDNNTLEKYVPATSFPYSRSSYLMDGSGGMASVAGVGEQHKMGSGHEVYGGDFAVLKQLDHYLNIRKRFFSDANMGNTDNTSISGLAIETVDRDPQGKWGITIKDRGGNILMSALPGNWITANNSIDLTAYKEEFILDGNTGDYIKNIKLKGIGQLKVYDNNTLIYHGDIKNFVAPASLNSSHIYKLTSNKPFKVTYGVIYSSFSDTYCDDCASKINTDVAQLGQDFHYFNMTKVGNLTVIGGTINLINILTNTTVSDYNNLPEGSYKAVVKSGEPKLSYTTGYSDISYKFYNQKGELIASMTPNGVQQLITNGLAAYTTREQLPFTNFNEYDKQGRLISATSTDAGRTEFIYRKDGSVRFSQNAKQRKNGRFSYRNYDEVGRVIESGEYLPESITFESAKNNNTLLENTSVNGGLISGTKIDWSRTHYDIIDTSYGLSGYLQDNIENARSWTENENSKTWYSYDEQGKLVWMIKNVIGLGIKTVDYKYDYLGNVVEVAYQKNNSTESFYHYFSYDSDQRLSNVKTSIDGINKIQQANYQYYLHGPLKRLELADNLQGIDYTYTAQGWLKTINHPSLTADPGKDGIQNNFAKDAFSMTLEYFNGDYTRNGSGINSLATNVNRNFYDGNLVGQSWKSLKPNAVVSTYGNGVNNPAMFTYEYDDKYQFSNNKYGTPDLSGNTFNEILNANRESNLSYDANGNINTLARTNVGGTTISSAVYHYQDNTNKLTSVDNYANYSYDDLGQMTGQQRINGQGYYVDYNVSGKVTAIYSDAGKTSLRVSFAYDEDGMRIKKTDHIQNVSTFYVYDSSGNVLAIYDNNGGALKQQEIPVFAASRLGVYQRVSNNYLYELSDDLGNVRVVINRAKVNGGADIVSYSDYYPFGSVLSLASNNYKYGYQGQYAEMDKETGWNNFDLRMYDPAIGRWMSTDPYNQYSSPYNGMGNNPVNGVDPDGGYTKPGAWIRSLFGGGGGDIYKSGKEWGYNTSVTDSKGNVGIAGHFGSKSSFSSGITFFGSTVTTQIGKDFNAESILGDKINFTTYAGNKTGEKGILNSDITIYNGKPSKHEYSLNLFGSSLAINTTDFGVTTGLSMFGVNVSNGVSLAGGYNGNFYYTNSAKVIHGFKGSFRPGGGAAVAAVVTVFQPELLPVVLPALAR